MATACRTIWSSSIPAPTLSPWLRLRARPIATSPSPWTTPPGPAAPTIPRPSLPWARSPATSTRMALLDLLVYFWGRTPVLYLRRSGGSEPALTAAAFVPRELRRLGRALVFQQRAPGRPRRRRPRRSADRQLLSRRRARPRPEGRRHRGDARGQGQGAQRRPQALLPLARGPGRRDARGALPGGQRRPRRGRRARLDAGDGRGGPGRRPAAGALPGERLRSRSPAAQPLHAGPSATSPCSRAGATSRLPSRACWDTIPSRGWAWISAT